MTSALAALPTSILPRNGLYNHKLQLQLPTNNCLFDNNYLNLHAKGGNKYTLTVHT